MRFVKRENLKTGMRLARPIYNKNGVLLYERNSKLTRQGIESIRNFGLIGIFILEPAEPVPPMTQADLEFERFQTMCVFSIREELDKILQTRRVSRIQMITANIIKNYGHLDKKISFIQNLRSKEDYIYKHSLNVAILCAMITHVMNIKVDEQMETVQAALVHDIGKLTVMDIIESEKPSLDEKMRLEIAEVGGFDMIDIAFSSAPNVKRICVQARKALASLNTGEDINAMRMGNGARVLAVAETYDRMTAVQFEKEPTSEVAVLKYFLDNPRVFDSRVVNALIKSINILVPGVSVELNTGEKALVLSANEQNVLQPTILMFGDNSIVDLADREMYEDLEIKDIMKTMDNRHVMDINLLKQSGIKVEEPEYVEIPII
ncbi:MAG: HD domain-containing protein [Lachnospiraceae bacterium]|jgi:HD-GYP domain-containing protein (c-di-GMP phosphodiesterase class II)|nr:HD domain-containing protein [Lachnospiraceae bacterium]